MCESFRLTIVTDPVKHALHEGANSVTNNDATFHIASKLQKFMEIPTKA